MAKLLVRTIDGENVLRYRRGDIVAVFDDDHVFGRLESLDTWKAEGRDPDQWPRGFAIVTLTGLAVADARVFLEPVMLAGSSKPEMAARRKSMLDLDVIERRMADSGRATLLTNYTITRAWSEVRDAMKAR